jgi:sec-independent protein translocase protein TatA
MNIGPMEVIIIFVVALLVFGPAKLPEIGRQVGKAIREFRRFQSSYQNEFRDLLEDPPPGPVIPQPAPMPAAEQTAEAQAEAPAPSPPGPVAPPGPAVPLRPVTGDEAPSGNGDGATSPPPAEA